MRSAKGLRLLCDGVLPVAWNLNAPHLLLMIYCVGLVMFGFVGVSYVMGLIYFKQKYKYN